MRRSVRIASASALAMTGSLALAGMALADGSPPGNLGNGLAQVVAPQPAVAGSPIRDTTAGLIQRDAAGRVLVDVYARDGASLAALRQSSEANGVKVVTQSADQRALEGYVPVSQVKALARAAGVASVSASPRPITNVGSVTSQGVHAERVDRVPNNIDGRGITVGALSDSFDTATETVAGDPLTVHAADDIRTGDLPREGVTVVQDGPGEDEGRAMLQLVHDIAPRARECFATADGGQLGFADNILALAARSGPCGANVIVDDVVYLDEPMFGESVVGDAVNEVAAHGVHYFSSAGNGSADQAYQAPLRVVSPGRPGDRSNIDLTGVDPALYAGGFQDFDAGSGVDIAQNIALGTTGTIDMQWDDPVDPDGPPVGPPLLSTTGQLTADTPEVDIPFTGTAGQTIRGLADGIPSGSTDLILELRDPAGNVLQTVDTGTSPEQVIQTLPENGTYTFAVTGFQGDTGDFTFEVRNVLGSSNTSTDLNILLFTKSGRFTGVAAGQLNQLTGQPIELLGLGARAPVGLQMVIAKANTDPGRATQVRYQLFDEFQNTEYVNQLAPATFGHNMARGASSVAAYDPFRPLLPEDFTSTGGELPILFDSQGNAFPKPDIRRKPDLAATDGGNTTFFVADSILDPDNLPNFFGTSAAAPHAAGIAALALQAHGGPGSLSPTAMRSLLERSAFPHDLDPQHSAASGGGLTITADGGSGTERRGSPTGESPGSMNDPQFFKVAYSGPGSIVSLTFDGSAANPTGLARRGDKSDGLVFDPRPFLGIPADGSGPEIWTQGFPFTVGAATPGIDPSAITASFARPGVGLASAQQFQQMTVRFPNGALGGGRSVAFGVDRDEAATAAGDAENGNSADALGAGVLFPEDNLTGGGLTYRAVTSTGRVLTGTLRNRIGAGWTPVDGFGYINAEAAVGRRPHR